MQYNCAAFCSAYYVHNNYAHLHFYKNQNEIISQTMKDVQILVEAIVYVDVYFQSQWISERT